LGVNWAAVRATKDTFAGMTYWGTGIDTKRTSEPIESRPGGRRGEKKVM